VIDRPNGVLVSPNDEFLYVADNNNNTKGGPRKLFRFKLKPDGSVDLNSKKLIFDWEDGRGPDGLKMDRSGRLWVAGGRNRNSAWESSAKFKGGVYVFDQAGKWVEFIGVPVDEVTNCAFGGPDLKTVFISAGGTLWSVNSDQPGRLLFWGGGR
jgi:sugar lactone lactonase YvrE